jgi:ferredoxin
MWFTLSPQTIKVNIIEGVIMAKQVQVDQAKCIGCGLCVSTCPDVFELSEDGKSQVKAGADCEKSVCCQQAIDDCPAKAISWKEE